MCGIGGYVCTSDYDSRLDTVLPLLGTFMTERGRQSWGWTNGTDIYKSLGLVRSTFSEELVGHKAAMIHTRHSTTGAVIAENSHPFKIKGIIGVHNGMIYNHYELGRAYPSRHAVVDSEHIFHQIADGLPLSELEGYGAIVYWKDGILHLGRFNNGDLVLAKTEFGWIYASTKEAVVDSLHMGRLGNSIKFFVKLKEGVIYQLIGDRIVKTQTPLNITRSQSTLTWQNSQPTRSYSNYTPQGFWHKILGRWFTNVAEFVKEFPDAEVPDYAPKPPALALPGVTQKKEDATDLLAGYEDSAGSYTKKWGEGDFSDDDAEYDRRWAEALLAAADELSVSKSLATEVGICESCGLMRDVVALGRYLICEDCFHEGQREDDAADAEYAAQMQFAEDEYESGDDPEDFDLSTAKIEDPEFEEVMCELCASIVSGDEPVYVCSTDAEFTICRFCYRDEYETEEKQPTVTLQCLN